MNRYLIAFALAAGLAAAADIRAGAAVIRITPPAGMPLAGYYSERLADGVHDDLFAKALVIEQGGKKAAIVACDLIEVPAEVAAAARKAISSATGVPGRNVMISGTHTHTGPDLNSNRPIARDYVATLPALIAEAVRNAERSSTAATLRAGTGREESISFNRRFFMSDGTVGWNPGKLNPKIVRPAGPTDPEVPVLYLESTAGAPIATIVNFALHLDTVGGTRFSADYPMTLASVLAKVKGTAMTTLFTLGCAGNLNHIDVKSGARQQGHGEAERIGTVLAGEVIKTYTRLAPVAEDGLKSGSATVKLPIPAVTPSDIEWARDVAARYGKPEQSKFLDNVRAFKILDVEKLNGHPIEAEVQAIAIGDFALVGLPGEIFVELGQAIKKASPFRVTAVVSLANGAFDYFPDRKAFAEGNYEVISARTAEGAGEMMVETAIRLLKDLKGK